jgi:hypothetical protein
VKLEQVVAMSCPLHSRDRSVGEATGRLLLSVLYLPVSEPAQSGKLLPTGWMTGKGKELLSSTLRSVFVSKVVICGCVGLG